MRKILIYFGDFGDSIPVKILLFPNLEMYHLEPDDNLEDQIEMALLNDLVTPLVLVIAGGGETGKRLAEAYHGTFVVDPATLTPDLWDAP